MSEKPTFTAIKREGTGKSVTRKLRAAGQMPAVCYGATDENLTLTANPDQLYKLLTGPRRTNIVFKLAIEDGPTFDNVMVRKYQVDPVRRNLVHADFVVVDPDLSVTVTIPVITEGRAAGVKLGGKLRAVRPEVTISARPNDIPVNVTCDVTDLGLDQTLLASAINFPEGVEPAYKMDYAVYQVASTRGLEVEPGEGEAVAAEVKA